ncbi:hypothetical protein SEA_LIGMA_65 [Gordonia phage Ligma]|nr:hypothetical protein SEA_LIGMA_65 [Gordonia phage Ligma]UQT02164.1 hypothetical protein SEA_AXUMITE_65 [Gordonia phage Axumite]
MRGPTMTYTTDRRDVTGHSEGAQVPTIVGVIGAKGDNEQSVVLLTRFDSILLTPRMAVRLAGKLIAQAAREVLGL